MSCPRRRRPPRAAQSPVAALPLKKLMRNLEEDAGSITGLGIASASAAMGQVEQHLNAFADDVMTFVAANIGDESDSASIVLLRRMVETLGGGRSSRFVATRRHGHVCRIGIVSGARPLPDELFLSGSFLRQGCRGGALQPRNTLLQAII